MNKLINLAAVMHFFFQALMPIIGAFVYALLVDSYNWIAAIIGFLGSIIYAAYFINHFTISKNILIALVSIFLPICIIFYECYISGTPLSSFFLKTAFVNLGALTLATSIPLLLMGFRNIAVLPGALVLAGISLGIFWMLYFTAEYLQPENISQSFKLLLTAVVLETVTTVFGLFGIADSISEKSNNLISRFLSRSGTKFFQMHKPEALVKHHDQIMTAVAVVAFVSFFVLIIA